MTSSRGEGGERRRAEPRSSGRRGPSAVAWLILVVGVIAAIAGARYWGHSSDDDRSDRFAEQADDVHEDVLAQLDRYQAALVATVGLFDASDIVTASEFDLFVDRLDLTQNYPGVSGLSFVAPVTTNELDEFNASLGLIGVDDLAVHPPSVRRRHDIVTFTAGDGFERGYDLATISSSREALDEARDTGHSVASEFHDLPTNGGGRGTTEPGFAIYTPLYRPNQATSTTTERRAALQGWLATPVVSDEFVASGIGQADGLGVELRGVLPNDQVIASYPDDLEAERASDPDFLDERAFGTLGRGWQLSVESLPGYQSSVAPAIALTGGVVIAFLMFALVWALSRASERRRVNAELAHQALHDPLTGLANRRLFLQTLAEKLDESVREGRRIAVFFIDLDHFKVVNDSLGHEAGDELLVETARRLDSLLDSTDRAARTGGDEFAVLRDDLGTEEAALDAAQKVAAALRVPYVGSDRDLFVPASIGVALSLPEDPNAEALLRNADLAMYHAKQLGRDRCELFDDDLRHQVVNRLESEIALHHALDRDEFVVFYQPEVSVADGRVVAVEALLRWWHPDLGPIAPGQFINVAEETGLIVPLGTWVLNEACRQAVAWRRELGDLAPPLMSVNLSARQVARPDLATNVARALEAHELEPGALRLEITENVLMTDTRSSTETVAALRELGVHLGIDDFGTGYSSLSYLQRFPVDTLKVDQSFVQALGNDAPSRAIVGSVIALAHSLDLVATAEGVETQAQLEVLRGLDCDHVQGNLLAPPQPAASFRRLLETTPRLGPGAPDPVEQS